MATTSTKVTVPAGTDLFDPQGDMVDLAESLGPLVTITVANTTERNALPGLITWTPSTSQPLRVWRANATPGQEVEYTTDGTTWKVLRAWEDTGWIVPTLTNSWSSISSIYSMRYRRMNGIVYLRGMCSGGSATPIMTLPTGYRPGSTKRYLVQSETSGTTAVSIVIDHTTGVCSAATGSTPSFDGIPPFPADN